MVKHLWLIHFIAFVAGKIIRYVINKSIPVKTNEAYVMGELYKIMRAGAVDGGYVAAAVCLEYRK